MGRGDAKTISIAAKNLQIPRNKLFEWLSAKSWIFKRKGSSSWEAYSEKLKAGLLEHKTKTYLDRDGVEQTASQARVTAKGLTVLSRKFG